MNGRIARSGRDEKTELTGVSKLVTLLLLRFLEDVFAADALCSRARFGTGAEELGGASICTIDRGITGNQYPLPKLKHKELAASSAAECLCFMFL